jgi:hypothetical protein
MAVNRSRVLLIIAGLAIAVAVGLFAVDALLAPTFGSAPNEHPEIQANLFAAASQAGVGGTVSFADLVPGAWDTVYVWDGYTADREHLVFPGLDFGDGGYGTDYVIAFAKAGDLVAWVRFNINDPHVFFDPAGTGIRASRGDAVFAVTLHPDFPTTQYLLLLK